MFLWQLIHAGRRHRGQKLQGQAGVATVAVGIGRRVGLVVACVKGGGAGVVVAAVVGGRGSAPGMVQGHLTKAGQRCTVFYQNYLPTIILIYLCREGYFLLPFNE